MIMDDIKELYIIITLLFVALIVQGYFIYDLKKESFVSVYPSAVTQVKADAIKQYDTNSLEPFVAIQKMQEQVRKEFGNFNAMFANDRFFQDAFSNASFSPTTDIIKRDKEYVIEMKIPGADPKRIDISHSGNIITVSAQHQKSTDENGTDYIRKESFMQHFYRSFSMPRDADLESIKSSYKNGILHISITRKGDDI